MSRSKVVTAAFLAAGMMLWGFASPKIELSFKNPQNTEKNFKNVMIVALNGHAAGRAEFEDQLVASLRRPGIRVDPSYEFIPRPDLTPIDMTNFRGIVKDQKFDSILVARLVKRDEKTTYVPGIAYDPFPYYGTFYGYYGAVFPMIYSPGYMETEQQAQVEVNFYSTSKPDGELVWTGVTNVFDPKSLEKAIKKLVKVVTKELEKDHIIPKPAK